MKSQPNRNYISNDDVQTPVGLAKLIVEHFDSQIDLNDTLLEPCKGDGNFHKFMWHSDYCEIKEGKDFFDYKGHVNWIITNPPWSLFRKFLVKAMGVADNVVFLVTINHIWTKARIRDIRQANFGIKEIVLVTMPASFPQSGFQLGAIHLQKNYMGNIELTNLMK